MKRFLLVHYPGNAFSNPCLESFLQHALSHSAEIDIRCRDSRAPKPRLKNLTWLKYGKIVFRIKDFYFKKRCSKALIWLITLYEVLFVFKKKYDLIIGVDREGLIDAGHYSSLLGIPYVYFSFEIMFRDEIGMNMKLLERKYSKSVKLWLVQDEIRANCLIKENALSLNNCFFCPIASSGLGKVKQFRLRDALGIGEKKKVAIMIGSLSEWSMANEIIKSVEKWPKDWVLIIHERYGRTDQLLKDKIGKDLFGTRIVCSNSHTDSLDDMGTILAGVDVGLAFYKPLYTTPYNGKNLEYIGLSSGKIATYLRYGIPILTNNIGIYADIIRSHKLGNAIENPDALGSVLEHFNRSEYSARCRNYFSDNIDSDIYMPSLYNKLIDIIN